ncbi:MAG: type II toxin-antitoxin system VapC family toxin [Candidatus Lutacidiplasmatales archaeon]
MKALDTPVLLDLLTGHEHATKRVRSLESEELCTSEVNMFELESLARRGPPKGRDRRLATLERLRRKLTVLPVDGRAVAAAALLAERGSEGVSASTLLMLGTITASGCQELITRKDHGLPAVEGLKMTPYDRKRTK